MESFTLGGFQLPFQRSISRLYNDTKKSSDFVKEPVQNGEDPELKALHRKLRIQKDRLVSWGLEWSDPTQAAEIDESLSKAGLSDVVTSVMSTIKDILAEAEPLWQTSKHGVESTRPSPDRKVPLVQWDKGRFEDLIRDLTDSIDTLYDLSRTRASGAMPHRASKSPYKSSASDDTKPFESSRLKAPQQIDPKSLTYLKPLHPQGSNSLREVLLMSKTAYSQLTQGTTRQPWAPLLLEYATFDSIYSMTGIMPPMARFEKLSAGLQQDPQRGPSTWTGLPRLVGYFEDMENSRLGLLYRFPSPFSALPSDKLTQNPLYHLPSLSDLLINPASEPPLEAKFRLAHNLANTVFDLHARGITHGNLRNATVTFGKGNGKPDAPVEEVDIRRPLVSSFDLFPDDQSPPESVVYRHPLDPRTTPTTPLDKSVDPRILELYSLAMILLSIGLWTELETLAAMDISGVIPQSLLDQLTVRCGSLYAKAVEVCWKAVDEELSGRSTGQHLLTTVQAKASRFLETCCILDGISDFEERLGQETIVPKQPKVERTKDIKDSKTSMIAADKKSAVAPDITTKIVEKADADTDLEDPATKAPKNEMKIRLYPQVALPPEAIEKWNKILMPQINHALRHFYRKNPESVEISLESVGPSPSKTQPTVLVVCTSVGKVRAILKKRLGDLFDGSTGFALKVCRGHMLRSRKQPQSALRSMARRRQLAASSARRSADDGEVEPINPEYKERPGNGASIGAWIGDRHLPPVSFGGFVQVDDKLYGMTVHHMLDDPDCDTGPADTTRSSGIPNYDWYAESTAASTVDEDGAYELSDTESEAYSETDVTSDYDSDEEDEEEDYSEPGDIPGIEPGSSDGYIVTQPALDDVEEGFYPDSETEAQDHLDSFSLGKVYASSGIRRKRADGLVHEVDWALFQLTDDRLPDDNDINQIPWQPACEDPHTKLDCYMHPAGIATSRSLPGMTVQCVARTSGLQIGQILPALTSVKIYGRTSPSHAYQVASMAPTDGTTSATAPMGIPGDSGAWLVDRDSGDLCGHVLAWSRRKRVAYICPMDVLLLDIAHTLAAGDVRLPGEGGGPIVTFGELVDRSTGSGEDDGDDVLADEEEHRGAGSGASLAMNMQAVSISSSPATSHAMGSPGQMTEVQDRMANLRAHGRRIDVTG